MKYVVSILFIFAPSLALAGYSDAIISSQTCKGATTISTSTAVNVAGTFTGAVSDTEIRYTEIYVENEDATAKLYCNEHDNVSTSTTSARTGTQVQPNFGSKSWEIAPGQRWYCISNGASSTLATICKTRR